MRGRPPVTRARVLTYWAKHGPCTIMQVCRVTGAERSHVKRILRGAGVIVEKMSAVEFCPITEMQFAA